MLKLILSKCKSIYIPYEFVTFQLGGYSLESTNLSIKEVIDFYKKHYDRFCKLSAEEYEKMYMTKEIPLKLLIKLFSYLDKHNKVKLIQSKSKNFTINLICSFLSFPNFHSFLNNFRKKIFRVRLSRTNPSLEILGIKII